VSGAKGRWAQRRPIGARHLLGKSSLAAGQIFGQYGSQDARAALAAVLGVPVENIRMRDCAG